MEDIQALMDGMMKATEKERSKYHLTLGGLIDKLKVADESLTITPKIVGLGAYRGFYSDIALCTKEGNNAYKTEIDYDITDWQEWSKNNVVEIKFAENPKDLAKVLESLLGLYFDGYKGGYNEITRDTPLWLAEDYGDCSDLAIMGISDNLELITKTIE